MFCERRVVTLTLSAGAGQARKSLPNVNKRGAADHPEACE